MTVSLMLMNNLNITMITSGYMRVQNMCQLSGGFQTPAGNGNQVPVNNKGIPEAVCQESLLWQGTLGTECVCYTDWCNFSEKNTFTSFILLLPIISLFYLR